MWRPSPESNDRYLHNTQTEPAALGRGNKAPVYWLRILICKIANLPALFMCVCVCVCVCVTYCYMNGRTQLRKFLAVNRLCAGRAARIFSASADRGVSSWFPAISSLRPPNAGASTPLAVARSSTQDSLNCSLGSHYREANSCSTGQQNLFCNRNWMLSTWFCQILLPTHFLNEINPANNFPPHFFKTNLSLFTLWKI